MNSFPVDADGEYHPGNSYSPGVYARPRQVSVRLKPGQVKTISLTVTGGAGYYDVYLQARADNYHRGDPII